MLLPCHVREFRRIALRTANIREVTRPIVSFLAVVLNSRRWRSQNKAGERICCSPVGWRFAFDRAPSSAINSGAIRGHA